jgi:hypothetical protein
MRTPPMGTGSSVIESAAAQPAGTGYTVASCHDPNQDGFASRALVRSEA